MKTLLFAALGFLMVAGCNPSGTCIYGPADGEMCSLDFPKKACASTNNGKFTAENRAQGLLRCKSAGFDFAPGGGKDMLFKKKAGGTP